MSDDQSSLLIAGAVIHPIELVGRQGPLEPLIELAQPVEAADHATVWARDGLFRASIPLEFVRRGRLDGGRLRVPDAPTKCWSVKDVSRIELTVGPVRDSVREESFEPGCRP